MIDNIIRELKIYDAAARRRAFKTKNVFIEDNKLELNTEKEGFMAYTVREDAQRPRAVYAINPDFRGI